METTNNPGWKTTEFWTVILMNFVALGLASGLITPMEAKVVTDHTSLIASIIIFIVGNGGYLFSRTILKLRYPQAVTPRPVAPSGQAISPSYRTNGSTPPDSTAAPSSDTPAV